LTPLEGNNVNETPKRALIVAKTSRSLVPFSIDSPPPKKKICDRPSTDVYAKIYRKNEF